jgi:hypothetical protein
LTEMLRYASDESVRGLQICRFKARRRFQKQLIIAPPFVTFTVVCMQVRGAFQKWPFNGCRADSI